MKTALALMLAAAPAAAQHDGHDMPGLHDMGGMAMPDRPSAPDDAGARPAAADPDCADRVGEDCTAVGTDLPAGAAAAPPRPADHYADRDYPADAMAAARRRMMREEGGRRAYQLLFNIAEAQVRDRAPDAVRWDGQLWFGDDIDRATLRSEGRAGFRRGVDDAELQALWSHAIGPYFNLQAGVRQEFEPRPRRTAATIGIEGLAPYWFQTEARLFLSTRGEVSGRLEGWVDQRLTQRLVFQPRVELNLAAQDLRARGIGAGLSDAELGLRLRYEVVRGFAPYAGVSYDVRTGAGAHFARVSSERPSTLALVSGIRFWF